MPITADWQQITLVGVVLAFCFVMIGVLFAGLLWFVRRDRDGIATEIASVRDEMVAAESRGQSAIADARRATDRIEGHQQRIQAELHALREALPATYVTKVDLGELRGWLSAALTDARLAIDKLGARLESKVDSIGNKLDGKVDKQDCLRVHDARHGGPK